MFRMFAAFSPGFEEAIRFCGICLNILVMFVSRTCHLAEHELTALLLQLRRVLYSYQFDAFGAQVDPLRRRSDFLQLRGD